MSYFQVFLGAPSRKDVRANTTTPSHWYTLQSPSQSEAVLSPSIVAEASRRVSSLYQNIIFREDNPEEEDIEDEMDTHLERPST
jgi:hypothetical protein